MNRRELLKLISASATLPMLGLSQSAQAAGVNDKIFINIWANGGWDASSFVDPKNSSEINKWADGNSSTIFTPTGSNISSGPWTASKRIVERHFQRMLVVNGVDCETNSHVVGKRHSSCGRLEDGFPSMGALFGEVNGGEMPLAYLAGGGGYAETADLRPYSRMPNMTSLKTMFKVDNTLEYVKPLREAETDHLTNTVAANNQLPRFRNQVKFYKNAFAGPDATQRFSDAIVDTDHFDSSANDFNNVTGLTSEDYPVSGNNYVPKQVSSIHAGLLAAQTGVCTAFSVYCGHFDTHSDDENDSGQQSNFEQLAGLLDYLWAKAADLGISERIVLYVNSDFARTPGHNRDNGKDHWPVTSALIMAENQPWTNKVIGGTDAGQNALWLNPNNMEVLADQSGESGMIIKPKHVLDNIRRMLGVPDDNPFAQRYALLTPNDARPDFTTAPHLGYPHIT